MGKINWLACIMLVLILLTGCSQVVEPIIVTYDFSETDQGWQGDFTDYPVNFDSEFYELEFAHRLLPEELDRAAKGLMLKGANRSDDLFMYLRKQLTALDPDTEYKVVLEVEFATDAPAGAVGIGGPPGEALFVKVGASNVEPLPVGGEMGGEPYYTLSVDKGWQSEGGDNAVVVGNAAKLDNDEFDVYEFKTLSNADSPITVRSDSDGTLWIFVGTDSGFEGTTTLYYTAISVTLTPVS
jgi:hypothetical protein